MSRVTIAAACVVLLCGWELASAQRVRRHGNAIVEYSSPQVRAVAAYEYSRRNHSGSWLLIELGVQATKRITIARTQITVKRRGKLRVTRQIESAGIDRTTATRAGRPSRCEIASALARCSGVDRISARSAPSARTSRSRCCRLPAPNTTRPGRASPTT